jgi:hypothetical protein
MKDEKDEKEFRVKLSTIEIAKITIKARILSMILEMYMGKRFNTEETIAVVDKAIDSVFKEVEQ